MRRHRAVFATTFTLIATGCIVDGAEPLSDPIEAVDGGADGPMDAAPDAEPSGCLPYDDRCPDGEYCQHVDGEGLRCIPDGDVVPDPDHHSPPVCPSGVCSRGGICVADPRGGAAGGLRCFDPCDPADARGCHNGRHTCREALGPGGAPLGFGVCDY